MSDEFDKCQRIKYECLCWCCLPDKWPVGSLMIAIMTLTFVSGPTAHSWHSQQLKEFVNNEAIHSYHVSLIVTFRTSWQCFVLSQLTPCLTAAFGLMLKQVQLTAFTGLTVLHSQVAMFACVSGSVFMSQTLYESTSSFYFVLYCYSTYRTGSMWVKVNVLSAAGEVRNQTVNHERFVVITYDVNKFVFSARHWNNRVSSYICQLRQGLCGY